MNTLLMLKQIQAESMVFYTKCFNLHWNITGTHFFTIHKYLEELYDEFQEIFDYVAEKIVQLNNKPYVTMQEMLNVAKINEEYRDTFTTNEALQIVYKDLIYLKTLFQELSDIADTKANRAIANYADERVDSLQKHIWQVQVQIQSVEEITNENTELY